MSYYDRLSALDSSFLDLEDDNTHMHVAVALLFEPGPLETREGNLDMEKIRAYIESRLHRIPRYRQRLAYTPVEGHPVWVDDPRFNLFYHVRHTSLPKPGSIRQLKRLCGRLLSQKLDRTKPLWEIWVIEGVEGNRFALVAKAHHCMVDGAAGADLLAALLSPTPDRTFEAGPPWFPRKRPEPLDLLGGEIRRRASGVASFLGRSSRALARPGALLRQVRETADGLVESFANAIRPASDTPLNPTIGPHRRFDWYEIDLERVKAVKRHFGVTINDVALATVSGAVRSFLQLRGMSALSELDFRALIPVNVRHGEHSMGNHVSQMLAHLPVEEPDAAKRLRAISKTVGRLKGSHQIEATEMLEELSNWTLASLLSSVSRLAAERRAFNLVVTNVPGPQLPLFLLGAPLREVYPMVPLFSNQALGVALFSYDGTLYWGVSSDWDEVPDLHAFIDALAASFDELHALAVQRTSAAAGMHA